MNSYPSVCLIGNSFREHKGKSYRVPYVFPETQQADNFVPPAALISSQLNFREPVLGKTVVSCAANDPHAPSQYIQQWSFPAEKSLGHETPLGVGQFSARTSC